MILFEYRRMINDILSSFKSNLETSWEELSNYFSCTITVVSMTMWKFYVDDKMKITEWKICEKSLKINYIHHVKHFSFFSTFNGN